MALRGLSDVACVAILRDVFALSTISFGTCGTELMLGGLVGLWTAAAFALRGMRKSVLQVRTPVTAVVPRPVAVQAPLSPYTSNLLFIASEVHPAVMMLHALDELETASAAIMLWTIAKSTDIDTRKALADSLAEFPVCANAPLAVAAALSADSEYDVAVRGTRALLAFAELLQAQTEDQSLAGSVKVRKETLLKEMEEESVLLHNDAGVGFISRRGSELLGHLALFSLALTGNNSMNFTNAMPTPRETCVDDDSKRRAFLEFVPLLDALRWEEIKGICTLAAMPILYEAYSIAGNGNLPLRFIGLGWVCALAGLVAYPRSASLWQRFQHACVLDCNRA